MIILVKLLSSLYVPQYGSVIRVDMVDDITFLIAYATTINEQHPLEVKRTSKRKKGFLTIQ